MKNEKTKNLLLSIACLGLALLLGVGFIYFWIIEGSSHYDIFDKITFVLSESLMIFLGIYGIIDYRKAKLPPDKKEVIEKRNQNRKMKKQKKLREKIIKKHKDMFSEFFWYYVRYHIPIMSILYVISMLLCMCLWGIYSDIPVILLYILWGGMTVFFIGYWIYLLLWGQAKKFKRMIHNTDYPIDEVNEDYMKGAAYAVVQGMINIGFLYTVYSSVENNFCFLVPNSQIVLVETRLKERALNDNIIKLYYVQIHTEEHCWSFMIDEAVEDVILETFRRIGVATHKNTDVGILM